MTTRYARVPSEDLLRLFDRGALLGCLRDPLHCTVDRRRVVIDVQLREGDAVMLYCGQTCLLTLRRTQGGVTATAHETYRDQPCASALMRRWKPGEPCDAFAAALSAYLAHVQVGPRWVEREGAVQIRWMGNDPSAAGAAPWIPLDREAVLGQPSKEARSRVLAHPALDDAFRALEALAAKEGWAAPKLPSDANELDQLGIAADGSSIVLVELKPADASNAYYAPFQLMRYVAEWTASLMSPESGDAIVAGVRAILHAKERVGLLSKPPTLVTTPALRPVLAFNDPPSPEVTRRLRAVQKVLCASLGDAFPTVGAIETWAWPNNAPPVRLD